jgi:hypothetical protein
VKDESRAGEEGASDTNVGMLESHIKAEESDLIDGVYAFPRGSNTRDHSTHGGDVQSKQLDCIPNLKPDMNDLSNVAPLNKNDLGNNKVNIFRSENESIGGVSAFPASAKASDDNITHGSDIQSKDLDSISMPKQNSSNFHKGKATKQPIPPLSKHDLNKENIFGFNCNLNGPSALTTQGTNFTPQPPSKLSQFKKKKGTESGVSAGEKSCQDSGLSSKSAHSKQLSSNSHHPNVTRKRFPEVSAEIETSDRSFSNNGKLKSVSLTLPNSTVSTNSRSASYGNPQSNNSISGYHSDVKDISRMRGQNPSAIPSIAVNGKVSRKLDMIGRGGSSEVREALSIIT